MSSENHEARINNLENKLNNLENNDPIVSTQNLISVQKGMLFFFLIISGNYIGELLSCRTQRLFSENMISKHVIALLSLYFFVVVSDSKLQKYNPLITLTGTLLIYVYFLCMAKVESKFFLYTLVILTIIAFTQIYKEYLETNKDKLTQFEQFINERINLIQKTFIALTLLVTFIGLLTYLGMKKIEYKKNFDYTLFFLGKAKCKNNLLGDIKSLKDSKNLNLKSIEKSTLDLSNVLFFLKAAFS